MAVESNPLSLQSTTGLLAGSDLTRFAARVVLDPATGCWLWQGPLDKDGYGTFFLRRFNRRAHRVAYANWREKIPAGAHIDHSCRIRHCVNPAHIEPITPRAHAVRGLTVPAINARKTHCPRGHPYDRAYKGCRYCSICEAEKRRRLKAEWRAAEREHPLLSG
jgi:hypothetical protein